MHIVQVSASAAVAHAPAHLAPLQRHSVPQRLGIVTRPHITADACYTQARGRVVKHVADRSATPERLANWQHTMALQRCATFREAFSRVRSCSCRCSSETSGPSGGARHAPGGDAACRAVAPACGAHTAHQPCNRCSLSSSRNYLCACAMNLPCDRHAQSMSHVAVTARQP